MRAAVLALALLAAGCGGTQMAWVNPEADAAQRAADESYCRGAAELAAGHAYDDDYFYRYSAAYDAWIACVQERGYTLQPLGRGTAAGLPANPVPHMNI